jgi:hypothetical protein
MDWKDIAGVVGKAAPILGTLIGGPAGAAIGGIIGSVLGTANTPDAIQASIATDPQAALKLAQYESDNRLKLQQLAFAHADNEIAAQTAAIQADVEDRKSARQREVDAKDTMTPQLLAMGVTAGFFGVLGFLLWNGKPASGGDALLVMLGALGGAWASIIAYYFGSSSGSDRKTELMAKSRSASELPPVAAP